MNSNLKRPEEIFISSQAIFDLRWLVTQLDGDDRLSLLLELMSTGPDGFTEAARRIVNDPGFDEPNDQGQARVPEEKL